jgi:glycosyltransferase involved in cell wall biosynthesis
MPRVTIGVPVYNSENLLEQCLANLAAQTFTDLKVIVLDNASTDGTAGVAQRFAARDSRFFYRRQLENVGAQRNFADVLAMAETPYFMWRADDDFSNVNFVERTVSLLDQNLDAALAVGRVISDKRGIEKCRNFPMPRRNEPRIMYGVRLLMQSHASWIYGLFRTEELKDSLQRVQRGFPHVIGFDHLTMFPFLISGRVVGTNASAFRQRFIDRPRSPDWHTPPSTAMRRLRRNFFRYSLAEMQRLFPNPQERALLRPVLWLYAGRSYRFARILKSQVKETLSQPWSGNALQ